MITRLKHAVFNSGDQLRDRSRLRGKEPNRDLQQLVRIVVQQTVLVCFRKSLEKP